MYAGNTVSTADQLSKENRGLKVSTNPKAGAAASNPSLLNGEEKRLGNLKLRSHATVGIFPCTHMLLSI